MLTTSLGEEIWNSRAWSITVIWSDFSTFYADYMLMQSILDELVGDYRRLLWETMPGDVGYEWCISDNPDLQAIREALVSMQLDARFAAEANAEITYAADLVFWLRIHRRHAENILTAINASLGYR